MSCQKLLFTIYETSRVPVISNIRFFALVLEKAYADSNNILKYVLYFRGFMVILPKKTKNGYFFDFYAYIQDFNFEPQNCVCFKCKKGGILKIKRLGDHIGGVYQKKCQQSFNAQSNMLERS